MTANEIVTRVQSMSDQRAGKVLKYVFSALSGGRSFSMDIFSEAINATERPVRNIYRTSPQTDLETAFETFRRAYKGTKRGFGTEYGNLQRKHADWREVIPELLPAWEKELAWHKEREKAGAFCPEYKNLQTWINQRCWETEFNQEKNGKRYKEHNAENANNAIRRLQNERY